MAGWKRNVFAIEVRRILAYRVDFWTNFLGQTFFSLIIAYYLWSSIFNTLGVKELNGFSMKKMIVYYLLAPLVFRIQQGQNIGAISRDIYEGSLNKFLLYPVNFYGFKLIAHWASSSFYAVQVLLVLAAYQFFFYDPTVLEVSTIKLFQFFIVMLGVSTAYFCLNSLSELVAFWADYIWSLGVILRFLASFLGGALIPLSFFPEWANTLLSYTPFPYLVSFPINILMEGVSWTTFFINIVIICFWIIIFYALSRLLWNRGRYRYTGIGI